MNEAQQQDFRTMMADLMNQQVALMRPLALNRKADHRVKFISNRDAELQIGGDCNYVIQYNLVNEGCNSCVEFYRDGGLVFRITPDCSEGSAGVSQNVFYDQRFEVVFRTIDPNQLEKDTVHRVRVVETYLKEMHQ